MPNIRANNIDIYYEENGPADGPVILLVMGLGAQMIAWPDEFIDGLVAKDIKGYWKRCSDLRTIGLIEDLGIRRALLSGSQGIVCAITAKGMEIVRGWA